MVDMEHRHKGEPHKVDNQDTHSPVALDTADSLARDSVPVASDMAERPVAVAVPDSQRLAQHTHCSVEQQDYLFPIVVPRPLVVVVHMASRPGETMVLLMDRQAKHWLHVHDA